MPQEPEGLVSKVAGLGGHPEVPTSRDEMEVDGGTDDVLCGTKASPKRNKDAKSRGRADGEVEEFPGGNEGDSGS